MNPLRKIKRFFDNIFGTVIDKIYWKIYYLLFKEDINLNLWHPFKKILLKIICDYKPVGNVLEVGCGVGFNLYELAKKFPEVSFYGTDISGGAIRQGRKFFLKKQIRNVFLTKTSTENLRFLKDKSIDLVFSYASLMYIGPEDINLAISEIMRVAKKNVILCEFHSYGKPFYIDHWIHNYKEIFLNYVSENDIEIIKLSGIKSGDDWEKYGHIIKIKVH